jgi:hypothetical protein
MRIESPEGRTGIIALDTSSGLLAKEAEPARAARAVDIAERLGAELRFPDEAREQRMALDYVAVLAAIDAVSEMKKDEWQGKHRDAEGQDERFKDPQSWAAVSEARRRKGGNCDDEEHDGTQAKEHQGRTLAPGPRGLRD